MSTKASVHAQFHKNYNMAASCRIPAVLPLLRLLLWDWMQFAVLHVFLLQLFSSCYYNCCWAQHDINGGSCLAMAGKDCVALVLDSRFGSSGNGQLVNVQARRVLFPPSTSTTTTTRIKQVAESSSLSQQQQPRRRHSSTQTSPLFVMALQGLQGDVLSLEHELSMAMQHNYARASLGDGGRTNLAIPGYYNEEDHDADDQVDGQSKDDDSQRQRGRAAETFGAVTTADAALISPRSLASYTSHLLYQRRNAPYYVEPMIVGLEKRRIIRQHRHVPGESAASSSTISMEYRPYLCSMDLLGSMQEQPPHKRKPWVVDKVNGTRKGLIHNNDHHNADKKNDNDDDNLNCDDDDDEDDDHDNNDPCTFCCIGAAVPSLYGTAQAFWKPNMNAAELAETCAKAFVAALERDSLSGYGARLYLITATDGMKVYDIMTRND